MLRTLESTFRQVTDEMAVHETIILRWRVRWLRAESPIYEHVRSRCYHIVVHGVTVTALVAAAGITTHLTTHRITSPSSRTSVNSGTVCSLPLIHRVKRLHPFSAAEWTLTVATASNWAGKCGGSNVQVKKHPNILYITACFSVHPVSQNVCLWRLFRRRIIDTTSEAHYDWNINKYRRTYLHIASVNWLSTKPDVMVHRYLRHRHTHIVKAPHRGVTYLQRENEMKATTSLKSL